MADDRPGWLVALLKSMDASMRKFNDGLKKQLRFLRTLRAVLLISVLGTLVSAVAAWYWPDWAPYFYGAALALLTIPALYWWVVLGIPLQAKSVVRLIDQGYPGNAKEIAIRVAAQKLHDESIKTEELLVDTAINEGKKAYRKYKDRAAAMRTDLDDDSSQGPPPS